MNEGAGGQGNPTPVSAGPTADELIHGNKEDFWEPLLGPVFFQTQLSCPFCAVGGIKSASCWKSVCLSPTHGPTCPLPTLLMLEEEFSGNLQRLQEKMTLLLPMVPIAMVSFPEWISVLRALPRC